MKIVFQERLRALRLRLKEEGVDAMLLLEPLAIRHVLGREAEADRVLITRKQVVWFEDARGVPVRDPDLVVQPLQNFTTYLRSKLTKGMVIAIASETTTIVQLEAVRSLFRGTGTRVRPIATLLRDSRALKSEAEIRDHERAATIADEALAVARRKAAVGMTEAQVARLIDNEMYERGAERPAFDTIVAFSEQAATPHHVVSRARTLRKADLVLVDMGAVYNGAHSDMSRTFLPDRATQEQCAVWEAVVQSQVAGVKTVSAGIEAGQVDDVCRRVLRDRDLEDLFTHATGHGVGLEIHEYPTVSNDSPHVLQSGMIVTVEPGVYVPKKFGVRIEDMLLVTASGSRVLTRTPIRPEPFLLR